MQVPAKACPSCGAEFGGNFCSHCGEKRLEPRDLSLLSIASDVVGGMFSLDGRVPRTLWALVRRPGKLTREWIEGRRVGYARPFGLFLLVSLAFFLIQPHTGIWSYGYDQVMRGYSRTERVRVVLQQELAKPSVNEELLRQSFNQRAQGYKQSCFGVLMPFFACISALLHWRRRIPFVAHLVFAIHVHVALLLLMLTLVGLNFALPDGALDRMLSGQIFGLPGESRFLAFLLAVLIPYLAIADARAMSAGWPAAIARAFGLFAGLCLGIVLYQVLVLNLASLAL